MTCELADLKAELNIAKVEKDNTEKVVAMYEAENERLKKVLEQIADENSLLSGTKLARQALKGEK